MIEFYKHHFKKNYSSKVETLIIDIERLLKLEQIKILNKYEIILDIELKEGLKNELWEKVNQIYFTLYSNINIISDSLKKFINKTNKQEDKKFKFIDTFAGCGGLSLGMENAGFTPAFINEIEPRYLETYYFNRDISLNNYYCGDIKKLVNDYSQYKDFFKGIDLFIGGPPCQGFSMANRQRIIDDPRNELYKYYLKLLHLTEPKFFIMENVKGMLNKSEEIKKDFLSELGSDYSISIILLNAKNFGVPQNRERVFVIGSRLKNVKSEMIVKDILKEQNNIINFKLKDALEGLPKLGGKKEKNNGNIENETIGFKIKPYSYFNTKYEKFINKNKNKYLFNHINRYNNERDIEIYSRLPQGENSLHNSIEDIMPYGNRNHMFKDKYYKLNENDVSKTITSHMKMDCNMYIHPKESRGLSSREAARIQTFPDDYVFMGANNMWYAQIGNAVPVKLAEIIGKSIYKYLI